MPATPISLVLFLFLIAPGIVYVLRRESIQVTEERSVFRDTAVVAFVSTITNSFTIGCVLLVGAFNSPTKRVLDEAVLDPSSYVRENYAVAFFASISLLSISIFSAYLIAEIDGWVKSRRVLWGNGGRDYNSSMSAWSRVFEQHKSFPKKGAMEVKYFVDCWLEDGKLFRGILAYYSPGLEETGDRDIVIQFPLEYMPADSNEFMKLDESSQVVISARRISALQVTMLDAESEVMLSADMSEDGAPESRTHQKPFHSIKFFLFGRGRRV